MIKFIDISAFASHFEKSGKYGSFRAAVRAFQHASSTVDDLRQVLEALETMKSIYGDFEKEATYGAALLTHAIVLYSRATHSKADARYSIGITKKLSKDQQVEHKALTDLRDASIAHFGNPRGKFGKQWFKECVSIEEQPSGEFTISFPTKRTNFLAGVLNALAELTPIAVETGETLRRERSDKLAAEWQAICHEQDVQVAADQFRTSTVDFYEVPEEQADAAFRGGTPFQLIKDAEPSP